MCFKIPKIKILKVCLQLTDVSWKPHHHGACVWLTLKAFVFHKKFKLGCIYRAQRDIGFLAKGWYQVPMDMNDKREWRTEYEYPDWIADGEREVNEV